jgi:hypothetical protein
MLMTADQGGKIYTYAPTLGIFRSDDDVASWIDLGLDSAWHNEIQSLIVNSSGQIFAGIYGGVLLSLGLNEWQQISFTNSYVYSLSSNRDQDILAGTYGGVYISKDGGQTWSFAGLPGSAVLCMDFDKDQILFAGLYRGGIYRSSTAVTSVKNGKVALPRETMLCQNYPNPFNPITTISYSLATKSYVLLKIFNSIGQELACPVNERKEPGSYEVTWNAGEYPSGLYFVQMRIDGKISKSIKMLLIK